MTSFLERLFGRGRGTSTTAKDRLQLLLIHDRINLPPERLQAMKEEIMAVISKYVPVDRDSVDIALEQRDRFQSKIVAEFPFSATSRVNLTIDENSDLGAEAEETDASGDANKAE